MSGKAGFLGDFCVFQGVLGRATFATIAENNAKRRK
jgi:hypothetical protein